MLLSVRFDLIWSDNIDCCIFARNIFSPYQLNVRLSLTLTKIVIDKAALCSPKRIKSFFKIHGYFQIPINFACFNSNSSIFLHVTHRHSSVYITRDENIAALSASTQCSIRFFAKNPNHYSKWILQFVLLKKNIYHSVTTRLTNTVFQWPKINLDQWSSNFSPRSTILYSVKNHARYIYIIHILAHTYIGNIYVSEKIKYLKKKIYISFLSHIFLETRI